MALNNNPFVEGIDPTSTFGGYASVLLQLIRQAQPSSTYGMILFDTTPPDVTGANAWRKRSIWVSLATPATPTVNVYREGGSPGWINVNDVIGSNAITTAMIQNAAVTLAKLSVAGGSANQLIRVNAGATGFEFVSLSSLVIAGSINVSSLITTGIPGGQFRLAGTYGPGVANWYTAQDVATNIADGTILSDQIAAGPAPSARSKFLTTRTGDPFAAWRYFEPNVDILDTTLSGAKLQNASVGPAKLESSGVADGWLLSKVAGVPEWVAPTAVSGSVTQFVTAVGSVGAIPTVGSPTTLAHTLGAVPLMYRVTLYCHATNGNYSIGDEIEALGCYTANGFTSEDQATAFNILVTSANVIVSRQHSWSIYITDKNTGAAHAIDDTKWRIRLYAMAVAS